MDDAVEPPFGEEAVDQGRVADVAEHLDHRP